MTSMKSNDLQVDISDAWALVEVLRHRSPCAADCEYCTATGDDHARVGYKLASKVQRALLGLQAQQVSSILIEIDEREAWMIYRYLPPTSYNGARALLMRVFKIIAGTTLSELSWLQDLDLN